MSDAQLREATGIEPHQQVNQICRRLAAEGVIVRTPGASGPIMNSITLEPGLTPAQAPATNTTPHPLLASHAPSDPFAPGTLLVIPCSGRKREGGDPGGGGRSVLDLLPDGLASQLAAARAEVADAAGVDDRLLMPAWQRYSGELYATAAAGLVAAVETHPPLVILSGGYGLVLAEEPIGVYDRSFRPEDWPAGLLEECLVSVAQSLHCHAVLAFCASSTGYAKVIRRAKWGDVGLRATLVSPDPAERGGTMVLVPRTCGEALTSALAGTLGRSWIGSDGIGITMKDYS